MSTALWSAGAAGGKATKKSLALVKIDLQCKVVGSKLREADKGHREAVNPDKICSADEHPNTLSPKQLPSDCEVHRRAWLAWSHTNMAGTSDNRSSDRVPARFCRC